MIQNYIRGRSAVKIRAGIESAIVAGSLKPGDRLPAIRSLAETLGVSPGTVVAAYDALRSRGFTIADGRHGTRVRPQSGSVAAGTKHTLAGSTDLAGGSPDPELLPELKKALENLNLRQRLYDEGYNLAKLVDLGLQEFRRDHVPTESVCVTSGALDGLSKVLDEHVRPGDRVAVEDPCFSGVLTILQVRMLTAIPTPMDAEGLLPEALRQSLKRGAKALILTPRAQNPTGAALTPKRAAALRRVLKDFPEVLVVEDDHASRISGTDYHTLVGGSLENWAVLRSVSKPLGPDLRVALLDGDRHTLNRVEMRQRTGIRWVSNILQQLVAELLSDRSVQALIDRAERTYTARRNALITALHKHGIKIDCRSGLNVWIPVPEEARACQFLMARGWLVAPGAAYRIESAPGIRITTARLPIEQAERLAQDIAECLGSSLSSSSA